MGIQEEKNSLQSSKDSVTRKVFKLPCFFAKRKASGPLITMQNFAVFENGFEIAKIFEYRENPLNNTNTA